MLKYFGIVLVIAAIAIGVLPQFTDCSDLVTLTSGKTQPMKCHWSAQAEMIAALPIGVVGILMIITRKKETARSLAILGIVMGAAVMLIPTKLIGICTMPTHICVTTMRPTLLSLGSLVTAISLVSLILTMRKEPADE